MRLRQSRNTVAQSRMLLATLVLFSLFDLSAFAEESPPSFPGGGAPQRDQTVAQYLQSLTLIPNITSHRDPFARANPPVAPPPPQQQEPGPDMMAPELERWPAGKYQLVATLLGDVYSRALIRTPTQKVLIVREKDKIGNKKGIIKSIKTSGIDIVEIWKKPNGKSEERKIHLDSNGAKVENGVPGQGPPQGQPGRGRPGPKG